MIANRLILIGASTGGPGRIHSIVSAMNADFDGSIIIAQHMAAPFITSFVTQLQSITPLPVIEVDKPIDIQTKHIYICKFTSQLMRNHPGIRIKPMEGDNFAFNPEINPLFISASQLDSSISRMGVILTGIGDDGAEGSLQLHRSGGQCYFENEASATVYGMPRRAKELVQDAKTGNMEEIIDAILSFGGSNVRIV